MAKDQADDEQNIRRRARRRLIGAAALTLAVVVILPMVLDSEPKPGGRDIDLRIPSPDKVGEFVPGVPVSEVAAASPLAGSAVAAGSAVVASSAPLAAVAKPDAASVAPNPQKQPVTAQPSPQQSSEIHKPSETRPAKEIQKPAATAEHADAYVAQVGAYSNPDTAKQELKKLKKWGYRAYTEKIGDKIRVRVGPYPDHDKAEIVGHLLEKRGLHPVIVSSK